MCQRGLEEGLGEFSVQECQEEEVNGCVGSRFKGRESDKRGI